MRSETRNACRDREPLCGRSGQPTTAKKVPSPEETQRANALGGDDGSVARARGNDRWDRNWRNDRRYDWQGYRNQYRSHFRAPRYYQPYGWNYGYQRFSIGISLNSLLFGQDYWLDDPYEYRLPPAEPGLRWVRYYNDVLLVDIDSGEVVDAIYDFFY